MPVPIQLEQNLQPVIARGGKGGGVTAVGILRVELAAPTLELPAYSSKATQRLWLVQLSRHFEELRLQCVEQVADERRAAIHRRH